MNCRRPIVLGRHAYGCGQCIPCRVNKAREWTHRILLEANLHSDNAFITLTYDDEHLPPGETLVPKDLQLFLKRHRHQFNFRYYAVGEYGDETQRPHYHLLAFGHPSCSRGVTTPNGSGECCPVCDSVRKSWSKGHVYLGECNSHTARYVSGYIVKRWTRPDHPELKGRHPEFARMSRKPGIGHDFMYEVASSILEHDLADLPYTLRHGGLKMPLGRYLRNKVNEFSGGNLRVPDWSQPSEEMQELRKNSTENAPSGLKEFAFREGIIKEGKGKADRVIAAYYRRQKRKLLK